MSHPLLRKLTLLRASLRRLLGVYAVCWLLSVSGTAVLVAGWLDYAFRFRDPGMRVLLAVAWVAVVGWGGYRVVQRLWTGLLSELALARRVQARFPALGDELAAAVEFLSQPEEDPTAGSLLLRRRVIAQATAMADSLDFGDVLEPRPVRRAAALAAIVGLAIAASIVADPVSARVALARLTRPLADIPWPQVHQLVLRRAVERMVRGQAFEVEVIDARGVRLPDDVRIHYCFESPDGTFDYQDEPMRWVQGAMVARRDTVLRPFWFRVEGGDDRSMPWRRVEVVDPPGLKSLQVRLVPPPYTGWPPEESEGPIRAWVGTQVQLTAVATKPLASAVVVLEHGARVPAQVSADGYRIVAPAPGAPPWVIEQSGSYRLELVDREGFPSGEPSRWEVVAVPDAPPMVRLEQPHDDRFVVPQAVVPLRVVAGDDLGLRAVEIQFVHPARDPQQPETISLGAGPERPKPSAKPGAAGTGGASRRFDHHWNLEGLKLEPGTELTFWAVATDYKPQTAKSPPRRLLIVKPEELAERLDARQMAILEELGRANRLQQTARKHVAELQKRAIQEGPWGQAEFDQLRSAELGQHQLAQLLAGRNDGIPAQILEVLADLADNRIDQPELQRRMAALLAELERLAAGPLPGAERELTAAIKSAQAALASTPSDPRSRGNIRTGPSEPAIRNALDAAARHQEAVLAALGRMTEPLRDWDRFREMRRDFDQLVRRQAELAQDTAELARQTLGKESRDLTPREAAELARTARDQAQLADRLDEIDRAVAQPATSPPQSDPETAQRVAQGLRRAHELYLSDQMRTASERIERNQLGQATQDQQRIQEGLKEVVAILSGQTAQPAQVESGKPGPIGPREPSSKQTTQASHPGKPSSGPGSKPSGDSGPTQPGPQSSPAGSGPNAKDAGPEQAALPGRGQLVRRVWGDLPKRQQQLLLQTQAPEEFLPQYESLIEAYYRRLAERRRP